MPARATQPDERQPRAAGDALSRPTSVRYGVLAFAIVMAVLLYLDRYAISVATPVMLVEMNLDKQQMGYAMSAFFWAYALLQVPAGWLADRWGARIVLSMYVVAWSLAMAGLGAAGGLAALVVMRLLLGIGQAGAYATTAGFLKDWIPLARRGFANSTISMGGRSGGLLANALTPLLMAACGYLLALETGHWRAVFVLYALLGLVWAAFFWRWFRDTPKQHSGCNALERDLIAHGRTPDATRPADESARLPWREMLTSRTLLLLCVINFCINVGWIFLVTWMPTYLVEVHGKTLKEAGILTALAGLAGMAGSVSGGLATDRLVRRYGLVWGRRLPGVISCGGAALAYAACFGASHVYIVVPLLAGAYYLVDLGIAAIWSTYQDIGGRHVATILGFGNMCGNLAAAIFASVIGYLAEHDNWNATFSISCGSFLIALVCWLFVDPRISMVRHPRV